jgi:hypothetical protein
MEARVIRYRFERSGAAALELEAHLDPESLLDLAPLPESPPAWTRLEFEKCPNCPLDPSRSPLCPAAARISDLVTTFGDVSSIGQARVVVEVGGRRISKDASLVHGIASLLGLRMATSGCPVLAKLRPMAAFHIPFATDEETMYRALATYFIAQLLRERSGASPAWTLDGLKEAYRAVGLVNRAFAARMRAALTEDANANALVRLDLFAKAIPLDLEDWLESYGRAFDAWL